MVFTLLIVLHSSIMSGTFTGFSETDIKNVQNGKVVPKQVDNGKPIKFTPKCKKPAKSMIRFEESENATSALYDASDIPDEAKLYKPEAIAEQQTCVEDPPLTVDTKPHEQNIQCPTTSNEVNKSERLNLEEYQTKQKLIEEQNRIRKEILVKALADKKKRTQEETQKLNEIQNEFKKLDASLSNDVKLLRQQIEIASIHYMQAEKRYLRIENAFLAAKLALQKKLEKKELLTEHLSRIIEQNEQRKAEKLTELLNKLEMCDIDENKKCDK